MKRSIQILALFSIVTLSSNLAWGQLWSMWQNRGVATSGQQCVNDKNGDGICDVTGQPVGSCQNQGKGGKGKGPGDGTGNQGQGPRDGSGYGSGSGNGTGDCDGTGPNGNRGGRGSRGSRGSRR